MRKLAIAVLVVGVVALTATATATAFEGGGRKPSEAPLINWGQHYTGQLNNHQSDANYAGYREVALWKLPPVQTHDVVIVNWHELPFAHYSSYPICMTLVQGIDDFNWGGVFSDTLEHSCYESGPNYVVAGSGTASVPITIQNPDASSTYLEFYDRAEEKETTDFETYPYDFTVEAPRHFLGLTVAAKSKVHANGVIRAAATLADGTPVPDGTVFNLTVTWGDHGIASYSVAAVGGQVVFVLALPEEAWRQHASFLVWRAADAVYQEVRQKVNIRVTPPVSSAAELACAKARQHAHVLARQFKRLKRHAARVHGFKKRVLRHKAYKVGRKLSKARARAGAVCAAV